MFKTKERIVSYCSSKARTKKLSSSRPAASNNNSLNVVIKKIIFALILFCFVLAPLSAEADTIADKQRQLNSLNNQIRENQKIIEQKQKEAKTLENEITIMDSQIREIELAVEATRIEISQTEEEISQKEKELTHQKKVLNESLRLMYEEKETSLLETLLSSKSFSAVLDRIEYLSIVKNKVDKTIENIARIKIELEERRNNLVILKTQQEAQSVALNSQKTAKNQLLADTKGIEEEYQNRLATTQKQYKETKAELVAMERASSSPDFYVPPLYPGMFLWPIAPMDLHRDIPPPRCFQCYPGHSGIDFGYNMLPVRAAADGIVTADGKQDPNDTNTYAWAYVYGNYVQIDHAGGFQTRYAHLWYNGRMPIPGGINVNKRVSRGDIIGFVGNTGYSTGAHLHFEIRAGGRAVNPMNYLP
ncbi:peptidoglycan DD-metalloendopeptidase family protein, partial [Patescibacteria group bacterium]|nr:peptidoglycan DD-metalloendopeptidase family protein [Patescibacteria group bacterium]